MNLVQLLINGISYSQTQNGAYALILSEIEGERKLPIVIGTNEAQSIAIAIEKEIKPPRPLTHDLFKNFCVRFDIKIKQVIIHKLVDGVFYSSVICERDGIEEIIDSPIIASKEIRKKIIYFLLILIIDLIDMKIKQIIDLKKIILKIIQKVNFQT